VIFVKRKLLFGHILFFFFISLYAQDKFVRFTTKIEVNGKGTGGAQVVITQNGKPFQTITTNDDGKVKVDLPAGFNYQFSVTKPQHCTKKFEISTIGIPPEERDLGFDVQAISLFQPMPGIDYSVLNKPLFKAVYAAGKGMDYDEAYANMMLSELQRLKTMEQQAIAAAKERENNYKNAITNADNSFKKKEWQTAITYYNEALKYKPEENYPKDQINQINKIIAEEEARKKAEAEAAAKAKAEAEARAKAELDAKYNAAIKKGDDAFAKKDWNSAKAGYNEALSLKPNEQYPKNQLAAIDKAMADEAAAKAKAEAEARAKAELDAKYNAAIKKGDDAFAKKDWNTAKAGYNEALSLKPNEQYPKNQLAAIDKAMADEAAAKAKAEAEARAKAELDAKYNAAIKKGDDAFAKKDWNTAKAGYNEALGLKPNEQYPKNQLAAIDKAMADEAAAKAKAEAEARAKAELEAKYNAAIKKGDEAFNAKDWNTAKAAFTEASGLKPNEQYPKDKIAAINKILADEAAAKAKSEAEAKAMAEKEAKYNAAVKKGDEAFTKKDWNTAKAAYNEALNIKPAEQYPKNQLAAIDKAIADEAAAKAKAEADAKAKAELEAKYKAAIKKGDDAFAKKDWNTAKIGYEEALGLKPDEKYPKEKLSAIEKILADELAAKAKQEAEAKNKAELDAKYNAAIKKGDDAFTKKDWTTAKDGYNEALSYKPAEKYPKDRLAAIEKALQDEANAQAKADEAKAMAELEKNYNAAIKNGDAAFSKRSWDEAKNFYQEALSYKPDAKYPSDQLKKIEEEIKKNALAEEEQKYKSIIQKADLAFLARDWNAAKSQYQLALNMRPNEQYPKKRIAEIEENLKKQNVVKNEPPVKPQTNENYNKAIQNADKYYSFRNWSMAKRYYQEALVAKANDEYATKRLQECEKNLNSDMNDIKRKRKQELLAKYGEGVTEETIESSGVTITQRVVVRKGEVWVYQKKYFSTWGGVVYYRDDEKISESEFELETKP
jgi:hypothetical protein